MQNNLEQNKIGCDNCDVPVQCIFNCQQPSKSTEAVVLWNFLRSSLGFVATEDAVLDLCDGVDPENCGLHPDHQDDESESLYQQGVFISLQNRHNDLISEWSVAAACCKHQTLEFLCDLRVGVDKLVCHFRNCPRI